MRAIRDSLADLLEALGSIPIHLAQVVVGLVFAIGNDRTAASFCVAAAILTPIWGLAVVGVLVAVYGVLMFAQQAIQAFLS